MKRITFGVVVSLLTVVLCGSVFALRNEPDEFWGFKWGVEFKDLKGTSLVQDSQDGDDAFYVRKEDELKIGEAEVKAVKYGFYKDKFYAVVLEFSDRPNFVRFKDMLEKQHGSGDKAAPKHEQYLWAGEKVAMDLSYNSVKNRGRLLLFYKPVYEQRKADLKKNGKGQPLRPRAFMDELI